MAPDPHTQPRLLLECLYWAAVARAQPIHCLAPHLPAPPDPARGRTLVLGAGKAAGAMAHAVEALWPDDAELHAPLSGLVVTRYGHTPPRPPGLTARIEVVEASHPLPDAAGVAASQRMLALTRGLTPDDLVLCLISGGGSALLTLPADGLELADKQRINRALLHSGASISEMNTVRKHLSRIKGGRLAQACAPARVVTLAISDVPGDDVSVIASGPTVADATSCAEALSILKHYRIDAGALIAERLARGDWETPKPGDPLFAGHQVRLVATPRQSLEAAAQAARAAGVEPQILSDAIEGESRDVGREHAAMARAIAGLDATPAAGRKPVLLLSGGETTVTVTGAEPPGRGGRAGEFCLGLVQGLAGHSRIWALAADTDGIDGTEDNAGAFVVPDTLARAQALGLDVAAHLARHDAYGYFSALGDLLLTGPTHTNVNDFRALLVT